MSNVNTIYSNSANSYWDTASNKDAERGLAVSEQAAVPGPGMDDPLFRELAALYRSAVEISTRYNTQALRGRLQDGYRAYANQHVRNSKYLHDRYKGRSKLAKPKTRTAIKKKMVTAAAALFSSRDILIVESENAKDPKQLAGAKLGHALLNYRLTRPVAMGGIPWFQTVMGAVQDGNITGKIVSKQYWEHRRVEDGSQEVSFVDGAGNEIKREIKPKYKVVSSKPCIKIYARENVLMDPNHDWADPSQSGSYLILRDPTPLHEVKTILKQDVDPITMENLWLPLTESQILSGRVSVTDDTGIQAARDKYATGALQNERSGGTHNAFTMIYMDEVFVVHEGIQYTYWMIGNYMASKPKPLEKAYPAHKGFRPVSIGVTEIEAHKPDPMSPVEAWMPLQMEANDLVNTTLDGIKQTVHPYVKVKKGSGVSLQQLQNRTADGVVIVRDQGDVQWDRPNDISGAVFNMSDRLSAEFDDLAGQFNGASVQQSRQMNETVGGMRILSNHASSVSDFDLKVVIETWMQGALYQILQLELYYEHDAQILAMAGQEANDNLPKDNQIYMIDDSLLEQAVLLRVDVGMGNTDPQARLNRLTQAWGTAKMVFGDDVVANDAKRKVVLDEIFSLAGYRDGQRFLNPDVEDDPRLSQMQSVIQQLQGELQSRQAEFDNKLEQIRLQIGGRIAAAAVKDEHHRQRHGDTQAPAPEQQRGDAENALMSQIAAAFAGGDGLSEPRDHERQMQSVTPADGGIPGAAAPAPYQDPAPPQAPQQDISRLIETMMIMQQRMMQGVTDMVIQSNHELAGAITKALSAPKIIEGNGKIFVARPQVEGGSF